AIKHDGRGTSGDLGSAARALVAPPPPPLSEADDDDHRYDRYEFVVDRVRIHQVSSDLRK
ncbi:MAG TPA: hypothetical protein VLG09_06225, partial [Candidatus Saccharimonadales bacterium]|nr:hypothetical protein [Candidatus Saccharimonadales bacterium]